VSGAAEAIHEVSQRLQLADFLHGQDVRCQLGDDLPGTVSDAK